MRLAFLVAGPVGTGLLVALSGVAPVSGGTAGLLRWCAWLLPGLMVAFWLPATDWKPDWRQLARGAFTWIAVPGLVATLVALLCALGWGRWDPGGQGLVDAWRASSSGTMAIEVSAPHTLGLLQAAMIATAPIWALPQGLGLAVWSRVAPRGVGEAGFVALAAVLLSAEFGAGAGVAGAAFSALVLGVAGEGVWARAIGMGAMLGLPSLGPLLASGGLGWTHPVVWGVGAVLGVGLFVAGWACRRVVARPSAT